MKELKQLVEEGNDYIVISTKGVAMNGTTPALLALYSMLTKEMMTLKFMDKKLLDKAYELGYKSQNEISKVLLEIMKEHLKVTTED